MARLAQTDQKIHLHTAHAYTWKFYEPLGLVANSWKIAHAM